MDKAAIAAIILIALLLWHCGRFVKALPRKKVFYGNPLKFKKEDGKKDVKG